MKKIASIIAVVAIGVLCADEIDDMLSKINSTRESTIPKEELVSIPSPMPKVVVEHNSSKDGNVTTTTIVKEETFDLTAIMNNSAFINKKWVKIGENVGSYKLVDIMDDSVYLKDGNRTKLIFFKKNNAKIKITVGR